MKNKTKLNILLIVLYSAMVIVSSILFVECFYIAARDSDNIQIIGVVLSGIALVYGGYLLIGKIYQVISKS